MANKSETGYAKMILLGANMLFAILGFMFLLVKALILKKMITSTYITLGIFGLLLAIFTYLGFFSKLKNDDFMTIIFSACLLIIFIVEMSLGLLEKQLNHNQMFAQEMTKMCSNKTLKIELKGIDMDQVQIEHNCCGWMGPNDWLNKSLIIPPSCCLSGKTVNDTKISCNTTSTLLHQEGCCKKITKGTNRVVLRMDDDFPNENSTTETYYTKSDDENDNKKPTGGSSFYSGRLSPSLFASLLG